MRKSIRNFLATIMLLVSAFMSLSAMAGFLQFPLKGCSNASCTDSYDVHGAYSEGAITSVLDHKMALNSNGFYPYGTKADSAPGGDLKITAFNGETATGPHKSGDFQCIGGLINLHPDWNPSKRMTNDNGCKSSLYSSYDEHPGYDYYATAGTPVYAAAGGTVISTICYTGNMGGTCDDWGSVAINHGNGYFSQYIHMNITPTQIFYPGQQITAGQQIGTVGNKCYGCLTPLGPHLHFEVRHIGPTIGSEAYPIVDPYGWVGGGTDPLYSAPHVTPANLWK